MSNKSTLKPIAAALGVSFVVSMSTAAENPFAMTEFGSSGYMVAGHEAEGKCGGEKKEAEGKFGEGKCNGKKLH